MSNLENRVSKLEDQTGSTNDLETFFVGIYTALQPDAPPPKFKNLPKMSASEYIASLQGKVLRPKIRNDSTLTDNYI